MIERRIVRRYAEALFAAASKADVIERVESDLGLVAYALETSPSLMEVVRSPVVPRDKKKTVLQELFAGRVDGITLSFLDLLVEKRREEVALQVEPDYVELADEARGIVKAQVTTAVEPTPQERSRLAEKLRQITGRRVELSTNVDPDIIGGVIVRIGDTLIDGSIRGQLEALREKLIA